MVIFKRSKSASLSSLFSTFYESFVAILWVFCIAFMSFLLYFFEFFSFYEFFVVFFEFFVIFFWVFFLFQHFPTTQWAFWPNLLNLYKKIVSFLSPMSFFCKCWDWSKVKTNWANQGTAKVSGNSNWVISVKKMVEIIDSSNFFFSFISPKGQNRPVHASMCQFMPVHTKSSISFMFFLTIATVTEYNLQKYPF